MNLSLKAAGRRESIARLLADNRGKCGVIAVMYDAIDDDRRCAACADLDGRIFPIDAVPTLPNPACTSSMGCRCSTIELDEDDLERPSNA